MYKSISLVIVFLAIAVTGDDKAEKADKFVDAIMEDIKGKHKTQLEPFKLPDHVIHIEHKVLLLTLKGEAKLFDGYIHGIGSSIDRDGDAQIMEENNDVSTIKVKLGMGVLNYQYSGRVSLMGLGRTVTFRGEIGHAEIEMIFKHDSKLDMNTLESMKLLELKGLTFHVEGVLFHELVDIFDKLFIDAFHEIAKKVVEFDMKNVISEIFKETNIKH